MEYRAPVSLGLHLETRTVERGLACQTVGGAGRIAPPRRFQRAIDPRGGARPVVEPVIRRARDDELFDQRLGAEEHRLPGFGAQVVGRRQIGEYPRAGRHPVPQVFTPMALGDVGGHRRVHLEHPLSPERRLRRRIAFDGAHRSASRWLARNPSRCSSTASGASSGSMWLAPMAAPSTCPAQVFQISSGCCPAA